jgi:hypothetical protein
MGFSNIIYQLLARQPHLGLEKQELDPGKMGNNDQPTGRTWNWSGCDDIRNSRLAKGALHGDLPPIDEAYRVHRRKY